MKTAVNLNSTSRTIAENKYRLLLSFLLGKL